MLYGLLGLIIVVAIRSWTQTGFTTLVPFYYIDVLKGDPKMVGTLLPPSVGGAPVNLAALVLGKVPVNLNYTASNESLASVAKQCDIKTVITSQAFLEKVPLEVPGEASAQPVLDQGRDDL